jgi:hypothetical protein
MFVEQQKVFRCSVTNRYTALVFPVVLLWKKKYEDDTMAVWRRRLPYKRLRIVTLLNFYSSSGWNFASINSSHKPGKLLLNTHKIWDFNEAEESCGVLGGSTGQSWRLVLMFRKNILPSLQGKSDRCSHPCRISRKITVRKHSGWISWW